MMSSWLGTVTFDMESFYNNSDITRENENIYYIAEQLVDQGYPISLTNPKIIADITDFPKVSVINSTKQNILDITNGFYYPSSAPVVSVNLNRKQVFDYVEANKLELVIQALYELIIVLTEGYRYCGTFACGEEVIL